MTILWHVDDLKASHKVIDDFIMWIKNTYGKIDKVKVVQGKVQYYLDVKLDNQVMKG